MLEVKPDIKDAEREEIVQTLKDTMVKKSGSRIMPEFVVGITMSCTIYSGLSPTMYLYMYIMKHCQEQFTLYISTACMFCSCWIHIESRSIVVPLEYKCVIITTKVLN